MGTIAFGTASIWVNMGAGILLGDRTRANVAATALDTMSNVR